MVVNASLQAPSLATFLKVAHKGEGAEILIALLKRRQIRGSRNVSLAVARLFLGFISNSRQTHLHDAEQLLSAVKELGKRLEAAQPSEVVIGNIVRRVLGVIRDEVERANPSKMDELAWVANRESRLGEIHSDESEDDTQTPVNERAGQEGEGSRPATASTAASGFENKPDRIQRHMSKVRISSPHSSISRSSSLMISPRPTLPATGHHSMFSLLSLPGTPYSGSLASTPPRTATSRPGTQEGGGAGGITGVSSAGAGASGGGSGGGGGGNKELDEQLSSAGKRELKPEIISGLQEILDELSMVDEQIGAHSESYIHANEIILTHGSSLTVQKFLLKAATKRKFTVVVVESFPNDHVKAQQNVEKESPPQPQQTPSGGATSGKGKGGKAAAAAAAAASEQSAQTASEMKRNLTKLGVEVIVIPDSAIFAFMSRVNKVILGTHAILSNGSLIAAAGTHLIARCAAEYSTPVVVVAGMYKVSPVYPFDVETLLDIGDASKVVSWEEGEIVEKADVVNPIMDFVPEGLVDLFVTNVGGHPPKYLYKIVEENYHLQDITL